ncbi:MAG: ABC transporter permease subunit, partial [Xanthobacteraceae bacterium]
MSWVRDRLFALMLVFGLLLPAGAQAQTFEAALAGFATDSYSDTEAAITAIAASGNPLALQVISALQDGRLQFSADKKIYIQTPGGLLDAATGASVSGPPPTDLNPVRLNNRLRRAVDAAIGSLTLLSPDPAKRLDAARAVFKARDVDALKALNTAIERETESRIKRVMLEARAAITIYSPQATPAEKIDAIAIVRERGDQDARGLLAGVPENAGDEVKRAATNAVAAIDSRLAMWSGVQNAWYGLSLGSVLLLAAIGLAITFGVMGVINMAHGEMVMLGAYTTFAVQEVIRTYNPALFDMSLVIAVPLAFLVSGLIGVLIERCVIRFLYGRPLETLLATWGLSLILQQAVRT